MIKNLKESQSLLLIWRTKDARPRLFVKSLVELSSQEFKLLLSIHNRYLEYKSSDKDLYEDSLTGDQEQILLDVKSKLDLDDSITNDTGWNQYEWNTDITNPIHNYNITVTICCGE